MDKSEKNKLLTEYRRDFHRHPEYGWLTFRTSIIVAEQLELAGYKVYVGEEIIPLDQAVDPSDKIHIDKAGEKCRRELAEEALPAGMQGDGLWKKWESRMGRLGGVIAVWDSGRSGPSMACRFDMDALLLNESTEESRVPVREDFVSCHPGIFHGCGHDGHTAVGLVTALSLMEQREYLAGKIIFIFQPAEEGVRGAQSYCRNWKFGKIDYFLSGHIGFTGENTFVAGAENFLATTKIDAEYIGRSAHAGANPERGRNALLAMTEAVMKMQEIPKPGYGIVRLNVGKIKAGESRNTIPAYAELCMETRGSENTLNSYMQDEAERIILESAGKYGVRCELEIRGGCRCADSSEELSCNILKIVHKSGLYRNCVLHQPFGASDDATEFMTMVQENGGQAAYMLFGCRVVGRHHESIFDFDESVLEKCCEAYILAVNMILSAS